MTYAALFELFLNHLFILTGEGELSGLTPLSSSPVSTHTCAHTFFLSPSFQNTYRLILETLQVRFWISTIK